jgi:hypothetical protein
MAKTARRKRKPFAATGKRRRVYSDLLDIKAPRAAKAPSLEERKKALKSLLKTLPPTQPISDWLPRPLTLPRNWRRSAPEVPGRLRDDCASASPVVVKKLSGKAWVPEAYAQRPNELLAMGITDASRALAEASKIDCAKPLEARYIEKLLRGLGTFPKAHRGSPKQRPK